MVRASCRRCYTLHMKAQLLRLPWLSQVCQCLQGWATAEGEEVGSRTEGNGISPLPPFFQAHSKLETRRSGQDSCQQGLSLQVMLQGAPKQSSTRMPLAFVWAAPVPARAAPVRGKAYRLQRQGMAGTCQQPKSSMQHPGRPLTLCLGSCRGGSGEAAEL